MSEFKKQKLIEEREERVKKKREAKKAKQKEQFESRENPIKDSMNNLTCMADNENEIKEANKSTEDTQEAEASNKSDDGTEYISEENCAQDLNKHKVHTSCDRNNIKNRLGLLLKEVFISYFSECPVWYRV